MSPFNNFTLFLSFILLIFIFFWFVFMNQSCFLCISILTTFTFIFVLIYVFFILMFLLINKGIFLHRMLILGIETLFCWRWIFSLKKYALVIFSICYLQSFIILCWVSISHLYISILLYLFSSKVLSFSSELIFQRGFTFFNLFNLLLTYNVSFIIIFICTNLVVLFVY